jgi:hypothetical protein
MSIIKNFLIKHGIIKEKTLKEKYDILTKKTAKEYSCFLRVITLAHSRSKYHSKLNFNQKIKDDIIHIQTLNDLDQRFMELNNLYESLRKMNKNPF